MSIDRIRALCDELLECDITGEGESGQHHKISVRGKTIGWHTVDHHGDERVSLAVRSEKGLNEQLVLVDPDKFLLPPYVARYGYIGIHLDGADLDWEEVRELILDGYRMVAPEQLLDELD